MGVQTFLQSFLTVLSVGLLNASLLSLIGLTAPPSSTPSFVYRSYQTTIFCNPSASIQTPNSVQDVQQIVLHAISQNQTVKAIGARHSIQDTICTDGIPISMSNINYKIDNGDETVTFGAGIELNDAMEFLELINKTLIMIPAFGGITMGGAIATGAHGSSLLHPTSISELTVKFTIIDGLGQIQQLLSTDSNFNALRVHLGLLGIIIDLTVQTVPLFKMRVENTVHSDEILFNRIALNWAQSFDWYQMWWFPFYNEVVVSKGNFTDKSMLGNAFTNLIPDEDSVLVFASNVALEVLQATRNQLGEQGFSKFTELSLFALTGGKPPIFSENGITLENPATGYSWRLQSNKCTSCAWDNGQGTSILPEESSVAFDLSQFPAVFTMIRDILSQYPATFEMIGLFIRFSPPSKGLMAISSGRPTFTIEWTLAMRSDPFMTARNGIGAYQGMLQEMVNNFGGRPHWGKNGLFYTTPQVLQKSIPQANLKSFRTAMRTFDPNGIFLNKFGKRILGLSNLTDKDPSVTRCALQDYCICSRASDCAPLQKCVPLNGFMVCKDIFTIILPTLILPDLSNLTSILEVINGF